jgi:pseudaminic acid biosynthesis-associated methylase
VLKEFPVRRVLEVGCNLGGNLRWVASQLPPEDVYGVDINLKAIQELHRVLPSVNALRSSARELPFRDRRFDLVFTMGVLIHQPPETLPIVMAEIVRCADRYVLCGEYFSPEPTDMAYRGQSGALFKRDFGGLYQQLFPDLRLVKKGFLSKAEGWDDVTYWVFEKARA